MIRVTVDDTPEVVIGEFPDLIDAMKGTEAWVEAEANRLGPEVEEPVMGWPPIVARDTTRKGRAWVFVDDHTNYWESCDEEVAE